MRYRPKLARILLLYRVSKETRTTVDANLNNSAAALIAAPQMQAKPASGSPASPSMKGEERDGNGLSRAEGESNFSNTINNLEDNSVKESSKSASASTATEAPPDTAQESPPASPETAASDTPGKPESAPGAEPSAAEVEQLPDGNALPVAGNPLPELLQQPATVAVEPGVTPAPATELPAAIEGAATEAAPAPETPAEPLPIEVPAVAATAEQVVSAEDLPEATLNAAVAAPANPAATQRPAAEASLSNDRPVSTASPAASTNLPPTSANTSQSSMTGDENFLGGESQGQARGELPAPSTSPARAAFSLDLPASVTAPLTATASQLTSTSSAALAELDTMSGNRPLQPTGGQESFARGLGERLLVMADAGLQSARIKMHPEHLGPLEIRIQVQDDSTQVWFNAGQSQTREILEQALPRLRELMADQGMRLTDANVSGGNDGQSGQPADESSAANRDWREPPPFSRAERLQAGQLNALISARRLLDVYA